MKANSTADDYKKFQDSMTKAFDTKSSKNVQVSKDMLLSFNSYIDKNKSKVETFAKLDKDAEDLSASSSKSAGEVKTIAALSAKELIDNCNKTLDATKSIDLVSVFTIEGSYITKTSIKSTITKDEGTLVLNIDSKLSDINKVTSIDAPDKSSAKTLNIMQYIAKMKLGK